MSLILSLLVAGGVVSALPVRSRRRHQPGSAVAALGKHLRSLDARLQQLIQTRLDPKIMGSLHEQQRQSLHADAQWVLSGEERGNNRGLALSGGALALLGLSYLSGLTLTPLVLGIALINSWPFVRDAWRIAIRERRFSLLHLMLLYLAGLWLGGFYLVGTLGLLLVGLNRKIQLLSHRSAQRSLGQLMTEQPRKVWVLSDQVEVEIGVEDLQVGDLLVLRGGEPIPVDGDIEQGQASVDQQGLTGESQPVHKASGDQVFAATLVLGGRILVRVGKTGTETTAARISSVLERAERLQQERTEVQLARLEPTRWPTLAGGLAGWAVGGPVTGAAMLGCNYLPATVPLRLLSLLNSMKAGAAQGLLIRDGRALERLSGVDTVVFDKTGTLTRMQPQLLSVYCAQGQTEDHLLLHAAAAEQHQSHPVGRAILAEARRRGLQLPVIEESQCRLGLGLSTRIGPCLVRIGSYSFMAEQGLDLPAELRAPQREVMERGNSLVFVAIDDRLSGAFELTASLRAEAREAVAWLKARGLRLFVLSGDHEAPTRKLAEQLGMDGYFADSLPEQKVERLRAMQDRGRRVCYIGDGLNDAAALLQADVSISLRSGTPVATDAAQVVLMDDELRQLKDLWALAREFDADAAGHQRLAWRLSAAAASGVLLLPYKFWTVQLLVGVQAYSGIRRAYRPLNKSRAP